MGFYHSFFWLWFQHATNHILTQVDGQPAATAIANVDDPIAEDPAAEAEAEAEAVNAVRTFDAHP
jgi:hypothetical protein